MRDGDGTGPLAEARWFVAGDLPAELRPRRRGRRRVDSYCVHSLSPASSIKRRGGGGSLEWKVRLGRVELVRFGDAIGFAERWAKLQLDELAPSLASGPWFDVAKQIWCVDGFEITRLSVAGDRWWTVAVRTEGDVSTDRARLRSLMAALSTTGTAHSYASWLSERWGDPGTRRSAA